MLRTKEPSLFLQRDHTSRPLFLKSYLELIRAANLWTAAADIFAGAAVVGAAGPAILLLALSTIGLYGGGVVLNDVFDAERDAAERPERPIPSGRVSRRSAALFGTVLLLFGIGAAFMTGLASGLLAIAIALSAVCYDAWTKEHPIVGPLNMGLCRGLNLLLGLSAAPLLLFDYAPLGLIPLTYIAAVTLTSKGEVHGGRQKTILLSIGLIGAVLLALAAIAFQSAIPLWETLPFLALFVFRVVPPFWEAYRVPQAVLIRTTVKRGVLSIVLLDATLAALYAGFLPGLMISLLALFASRTARLFAVT
ncbi:MAG: UbiA-like protein EboC [Candidatus Manganitrophus sp.]|nr:MAG: UbiA-like protein EboC [Candidatus Manganitrophus sp.]